MMVTFNPGISQSFGNINFGIFGSGSTDIVALSGVIDIFPEENHNLPVTKTKYPIETGSSRTDNFVVEPEQLVLKGLVSNLQPFLGGLVSINDKTRIKEAWGRLRALKNNGELVGVVTLLGLYENMLVTNIDSTLSRDTGESLFFTITLEETLIAETEIVQLAPVKLIGPAGTKGSDTDGGQKQSQESTEPDTTVLQDIISGISKVFD